MANLGKGNAKPICHASPQLHSARPLASKLHVSSSVTAPGTHTPLLHAAIREQ